MYSAQGIIDIPKEALKIEEALIELNQICLKTHIDYCVSGSTAFVASLGKLLRIPHDVDVVFDVEKIFEMQKALLDHGYKRKIVKHQFLYTFIPLFEHYEKDGRVIEIGGAKFTKNGFIFRFLLPLATIPVKYRPILKLVFTKEMSKPNLYHFGKAIFYGLSAETQWLHMKMFEKEIKAFDPKKERRFSDLKELSRIIDDEKIKKILKERPGIYYRGFPLPLATVNFDEIMNFVILLMKLERSFGIEDRPEHYAQIVKKYLPVSS